jgi:hypothetical protein
VDGRGDLRDAFYGPYFALHAVAQHFERIPALLMVTVHDDSSPKVGGRMLLGRSRLICGMDAGESKSS